MAGGQPTMLPYLMHRPLYIHMQYNSSTSQADAQFAAALATETARLFITPVAAIIVSYGRDPTDAEKLTWILKDYPTGTLTLVNTIATLRPHGIRFSIKWETITEPYDQKQYELSVFTYDVIASKHIYFIDLLPMGRAAMIARFIPGVSQADGVTIATAFGKIMSDLFSKYETGPPRIKQDTVYDPSQHSSTYRPTLRHLFPGESPIRYIDAGRG